MSLIERAKERIVQQPRGAPLIKVPLLSVALRERAARAMTDPRFKDFSAAQDVAPQPMPANSLSGSAPSRMTYSWIILGLVAVCVVAAYLYSPNQAGSGAESPVAKSAPAIPPIITTKPSAVAAATSAPTGVVARAPMPPPQPQPQSQPQPIKQRAPKLEIELLLSQWAAAWSERDVDRYLSFYSPQFAPPNNLARPAWEELRRKRILGKQRISVVIDDLSVEMMEANRALVRFAQTYEADSYRETRAPKVLILAREASAWRIAAELNPREAAKK